jgi:hypothetical protein
MKRLRMLISWLLLVGAFVVFLAAHGLPSFGNDRGWWVWEGILVFLRSSDPLNDPLVSVGTASFLTFTVLILVAPFIHWVWRRSRLVWWLATGFSGLAMLGFLTMIGKFHSEETTYNPGAWCFMIAPVLNFAGLVAAWPGWRSDAFPAEGQDEGGAGS